MHLATLIAGIIIGAVIALPLGMRIGQHRALWTLARIDVRSKTNAIDSWHDKG